ncbi:MAG: substrate-binding domain-containing protein [Xanthobacteraceae bacterium]
MKVLCTNGLKTVMTEVVPGFERSTGQSVHADYASTNMLLDRLKAGAGADLAILTAEAIDGLIAEGAINAASRADLASSAIGIAVRRGAPRPDIGTVEALKQTLLAARSVAFSKTGISGLYAPALFAKLGIAEQMMPKAVIPDPVTVGEAVAKGAAEMAFQQVSELMPVAGVAVVGPLPAEIQKLTVFTAGIFSATKAAKAARALVEALRSDAVRPVYACMGLQAL